jgi:conjugal transfer/type IV secretion protein DotA/TraY
MALTLYVAIPQQAMASSIDEAHAMSVISDIMSKPYDPTDMAHKSLAMLFGGFIFEPFGGAAPGEPTALAKVLGYTNIIAMLLGVIIMAYVILAGALNTAASGEMLGRSWSSVWLPLRTSVAFGMIVPATSGGEVFSVAQSLVIWMIIVGSNSATWLWKEGVTAIGTGTPVFQQQNFHDSSLATPIIQAVTCSAIRSKLATKKDGEEPDAGYVENRKLTTIDAPVTWVNFKYSGLSSINLANATYIHLTGCGTIPLPTSNWTLTGTSLDSATTTYGSFSKATAWEKALQKKFDESSRSNFPTVITAAKGFADAYLGSGLSAKSIESAKSVGGSKAVETDATIAAMSEDYGQVTVTYEKYLMKVQKDVLTAAAASGWSDEMTKGGWMRAGAFFFEASRLQGFVQTLMTALSTATIDAPESYKCSFTSLFTSCTAQTTEYNSLLVGAAYIANASQSAASTSRSTGGSGNLNLTVTKDVDGQSVKTLSSNMFTDISVAISTMFINNVMSLGADNATGSPGTVGTDFATNTSGMISPFTAVSSLGRGLQQITVVIWSAGLAASFFLGVSEGWGAKAVSAIFTADTASGAMGALKYLMATLVPVLSGVGGLAFMLAFAIPFMPVTIWIMLVCGYLVTVIEAIAAAPLAVIMLATPEGEGMAGSSFKQALQMINSIILRPSLSIVGLFAAMTLSYVGFAILNNLFWTVAGLTTSSGLFEILALIFIYSTLAFKVCEYMVQVIHKIPDHIMQWMGGGMQRDFGEQAVGSEMVSAVKQNSAIGGIAGVQGLQTAGSIVSKRVAAQNAAKQTPKTDPAAV